MDSGDAGWIRVPVGGGSARWTTRGRCRRVLLVVHNVTSATRLLDVLPLFRDDLRVQVLATCTGSSPFQSGVAELLSGTGVPVLPWGQALETPVDLAVSASFGGDLKGISGQLIVLSHGAGYNKKLRHTGHRGSGAGAPVFGLSPEWLLSEGVPVADALVLSHPEQLERLLAACPEAAPTAVLAGDPCFDRMLAALPYRERFRRALGVRRGQRLIVLNSTWNPDSVFGDGGAADVLPSLLPRLTSELPADEYRLAAVLHPNIWHGHGPGQILAWLDRARRGGLALVDPLEGWRQALIAADAVIGDHGSVSYYAAALGTPVLLGAAPLAGLDPRSPVAEFVREAPRLDPCAPLRRQLDATLADRPAPGPAELATSMPGGAAAALRGLFYGFVGIPEPPGPALLDPLPLPRYEPALYTAPLRVVTRPRGPGEVAVRRYADPPYEPEGESGEEGVEEAGAAYTAVHTAVHEDTLDPGRLAVADVIFRSGPPDDPRIGPPPDWTAEVLGRHPYCSLAAFVTGPGSCTVRTRNGPLIQLSADPTAADPAVYASALHAWLSAGGGLAELEGSGMVVWTGRTAHQVTVTPVR